MSWIVVNLKRKQRLPGGKPRAGKRRTPSTPRAKRAGGMWDTYDEAQAAADDRNADEAYIGDGLWTAQWEDED